MGKQPMPTSTDPVSKCVKTSQKVPFASKFELPNISQAIGSRTVFPRLLYTYLLYVFRIAH